MAWEKVKGFLDWVEKAKLLYDLFAVVVGLKVVKVLLTHLIHVAGCRICLRVGRRCCAPRYPSSRFFIEGCTLHKLKLCGPDCKQCKGNSYSWN